MAANISSRTPEGEPKLCPVCGALICIEPSGPSGDAPCPSCGVLLWFLRTSDGVSLYEINRIAPIRERVAELLARLFQRSKDELARSFSSFEDFGADSLDMVELVMELEEEFDFPISDAEAERIRTMGDLVRWLIQHLP
jgi:acyl carrier protein